MKSRALQILALNSGSSSLKFGLYLVGPAQVDMLISGEAGAIGSENASFEVRDGRGETLYSEKAAIPTQSAALTLLGRLFAERNMPAPGAIGHRIVHGGPKLLRHCLIDAAVVSELEAAAVFAPLHMPQALAVIREASKQYPGLAQVACFDTSFHAELPSAARVLPVPRALQAEGIRRYGFHGLSCESIVRQLAGDLPDRLVIAHLGNGSSVTAVKEGRSIDTSMGLTPSGGVIMGTRTGDLDPGVLIYLLRQKQLDAAMLEEFVNRRSGLLGISGVDSDMRRLHAAAAQNADARLAIQMFCIRARKEIAAMAAVLEGIDMLVFTGGIGENDAGVRTTICRGLSWMGVSDDAACNPGVKGPAHESRVPCTVRVVPAQEDVEIARHTWELVPHGAD
jgi:acetate kinase